MKNTPSLLQLLHRSSTMMDRALAARLSGITPRQVMVLSAVADAQNAPSQTDLVEATGIDRSTLADIVRRLITRGALSRRRRQHDARTYAVRLTERGSDWLTAARELMPDVEAELLQTIPQAQRAAMIKGLQRITIVKPEAAAA